MKHHSKDWDEDPLRHDIIRLAKMYGRYGYRKIAQLLRISGWKVNHKKVERILREEGLQLPERHKRKRRSYHIVSSIVRMLPNASIHVRAINFVPDKFSNNRPYKMLTVVAEYTRQVITYSEKLSRQAGRAREKRYSVASSNHRCKRYASVTL